MGTTLTGTTPQDTYDSLIKVTDNGPLSGTLKALSDGLGNDSTLSLSTTAASIAGTLAVSGNATFDTNTLFVDAASNEVGIGTISPSGKLHISATSGVASLGSTALAIRDSVASNYGFDFTLEGVSSGDMSLVRTELDVQSQVMTFKRSNGNVGIGTSAPECKLHISGSASGSDVTLYIDNAAGSTLNNSTRLKFSSDLGSSVSNGGAELNCTIVDAGNGAVDLLVKSWSGGAYTEKARFLAGGGLTFNGDTAAANALDDYEEGTFTPTIIGTTTAGTATYGGGQAGAYTKIGNVVYLQIYLGYSGGTGTGDLRIAGLPFTIPSFDLPSFTFGVFLNVALTASNVPIAGGIGSTSQIYINQIPTGGGTQTAVPYDDSAVIQISGFYRV